MPQHRIWSDVPETEGTLPFPSAKESAIYSYDMLVSLKRMAEGHKQRRLAALLQAAANEAKLLSSRE